MYDCDIFLLLSWILLNLSVQVIDHMLDIEKCPRKPQYGMASGEFQFPIQFPFSFPSISLSNHTSVF